MVPMSAFGSALEDTGGQLIASISARSVITLSHASSFLTHQQVTALGIVPFWQGRGLPWAQAGPTPKYSD
jgi:hypothetical protein